MSRAALARLPVALLPLRATCAAARSLFSAGTNWCSSRESDDSVHWAGPLQHRAATRPHAPPLPPPPPPPRSSHRGKRTRAWQLADGMAAGLGADIVQAGNTVLREEAEDVPDSMLGTQELRDFVQTMVDTMRAAPGVGLAAPQIGMPLKIIVMEDRAEYIALVPEGLAEQQQRRPFEPLVIINPRLMPLTDAGARFFEGCLSVPGYQALVERYLSVEVQGLTPEGLPLKFQANGWQARILQHECDHLQGVLYVDRMLSRSFSARGVGTRLPDDVPRPGPCRCSHHISRTSL